MQKKMREIERSSLHHIPFSSPPQPLDPWLRSLPLPFHEAIPLQENKPLLIAIVATILSPPVPRKVGERKQKAASQLDGKTRLARLHVSDLDPGGWDPGN